MQRKTQDPDQMPVRIDTTIPYAMKKDCIKRNWSPRDVFIEGYRSKIMTENGTSKNTMRIKIAEKRLELILNTIKVKSPNLYEYIVKGEDTP